MGWYPAHDAAVMRHSTKTNKNKKEVENHANSFAQLRHIYVMALSFTLNIATVPHTPTQTKRCNHLFVYGDYTLMTVDCQFIFTCL